MNPSPENESWLSPPDDWSGAFDTVLAAPNLPPTARERGTHISPGRIAT
jgi:hypothetical protein